MKKKNRMLFLCELDEYAKIRICAACIMQPRFYNLAFTRPKTDRLLKSNWYGLDTQNGEHHGNHPC